MARPLVLSNGKLAIGLNSTALLRDLYYPYVGMYSHTNEQSPQHRIGVYCDGAVHWLDDGAWHIKSGYLSDRLIGHTIADNPWLDIRLELQDYVDSELDVFVRNIHIVNLSNRPRQVKLFMHQAFVINNTSDNRDTARYVVDNVDKGHNIPFILHYKDNIAFAISGNNLQTHRPFDSFSIGRFGGFGVEHRDGVWCDAADGLLAQNPIEQGATDSIIEFDYSIPAHDSVRAHYFLAAGTSPSEASKTLSRYCHESEALRTRKTCEYWSSWSKSTIYNTSDPLNTDIKYDNLPIHIALLELKAMTNDNGAIVSTIDSLQAHYSSGISVDHWVRDAATAALLYHKLGHSREVDNFLSFTQSCLSPEGYLYPCYRPDGSPGPDLHACFNDIQAVLPIEADAVATTLCLVCEILLDRIASKDKISNIKQRWQKLVQPMADFLADFIDTSTKLPRSSYDIWGLKFETTTYTTSLIYRALNLAADLADKLNDTNCTIKYHTVTDDIRDNIYLLWNQRRNYFYRGFTHNKDTITYDENIDVASFYGAWISNLFDDSTMEIAYNTLINRFNIDSNAPVVPRFEGDSYDGYENPWVTTTMWLAHYNLAHGRRTMAVKALGLVSNMVKQYNVVPPYINKSDVTHLPVAPSSGAIATYILTYLNYSRALKPSGDNHEV